MQRQRTNLADPVGGAGRGQSLYDETLVSTVEDTDVSVETDVSLMMDVSVRTDVSFRMDVSIRTDVSLRMDVSIRSDVSSL